MYWWPPFVLTNAVFHPKFINIKTIKVRKSKNCLYHYVIWSAFYSLFSTRRKHEELILCLLLLDCVIFPKPISKPLEITFSLTVAIIEVGTPLIWLTEFPIIKNSSPLLSLSLMNVLKSSQMECLSLLKCAFLFLCLHGPAS